MKILLTNDDGVFAEGLKALRDILQALGEVFVVAPDRERTAISHALTLHRPLRVKEWDERTFAVDGTPADCIHLGLFRLLPSKPDLVISGINNGPNMGEEVFYSGTVAAALEASFLDLPAFAISLAARNDHRYLTAAQVALRVAQAILRHGLPRGVFLNINVPNQEVGALRGFKITRLGKRIFDNSVVEEVDPRGRRYYWIGGKEPQFFMVEGSDYEAITQGYISVTPLRGDLSDYQMMEVLERWDFMKKNR